LSKKKVVSLDLSALISGAKYRGEFEERLQSVLKDISAAGGEIITFIDELHVLLGLGKAEGSVDAGNMLKPSLARGDLQCCGATTLKEYRYSLKEMFADEDNILRRMLLWREGFNQSLSMNLLSRTLFLFSEVSRRDMRVYTSITNTDNSSSRREDHRRCTRFCCSVFKSLHHRSQPPG
jgi:hypothetical protein